MTNTATTEKKSTPQIFSGVVVSDKMKDTCVVSVVRYMKHEKYHKYMTKKTKIMAHDPGNTQKIGDKVTIVATRPVSKNKSFKILTK